MPTKKIFYDPAFYILIILNAILIFEYKDDPKKYETIIWVYWMQSVLIGLFTFLELASTKNIDSSNFKLNDKPIDAAKSKGCYPWFFLLHYQFFHLAYFIFLLVQTNFKNIDRAFLKISFVALLVNQSVIFIRHRLSYNQHPPKLGTMFFLPYLRIVPMHLMILLPAFLGWQPSLVFLILKTIFDIVGYVITAGSIEKATIKS